jgi:hypothetical protein
VTLSHIAKELIQKLHGKIVNLFSGTKRASIFFEHDCPTVAKNAVHQARGGIPAIN